MLTRRPAAITLAFAVAVGLAACGTPPAQTRSASHPPTSTPVGPSTSPRPTVSPARTPSAALLLAGQLDAALRTYAGHHGTVDLRTPAGLAAAIAAARAAGGNASPSGNWASRGALTITDRGTVACLTMPTTVTDLGDKVIPGPCQ